MKTILTAVVILMLTSMPAYAYLDGGTGSILLQTLFAGVAGILAILKLYWYKIKVFFGKFFGKKAPLAATKQQPSEHNVKK